MSVKCGHCKHIRKNPDKSYFPGDIDLGLGDYVEQVLTKIGVTKERWEAAVNVFSEEHKTCNCSKRKKFFNWIGGHLGLAPGMDAEIHAMTLDEQPLRNCAIHGKCICDEVFPDSVLESIRSNGIEPCQHCSDFEKEIK